MGETGDPREAGQSARALLERLEDAYQSLAEDSKALDKSKGGIAHMFEKWFRGTSPSSVEPVYGGFLAAVEELTGLLTEALKANEDADERSDCAARAAYIMLVPKPANTKTQADWFMIAAEHRFAPLIPFIKRDALIEIRDEYLRGTPKRMMFPKQLELFKQMEKAAKGPS